MSTMLGTHKIIIDEWAEVVDLLDPYADGEFWTWADVDFDPAFVYIVGRVVLKDNWQSITDLATQYPGRIVFCNPAEGSETILLQLRRLRIEPHVRDGRILLLTSGDLEPGWNQMSTDCYFTNIVDYTENRSAQLQAALDNKQLLPSEYEIPRAVPQLTQIPDSGFVKHQLFDNTWGDAIVNPACYTDTWYSVVTETIFDYPHSFRTEKIYKPIIMAHPFVVAANAGYLRDLRNAGFQTFNSVIDEGYDQIDCPSTRLERIIETVHSISRGGAKHFWEATRDICKYNQQHLVEYNRQQRALLPLQLEQYLNERSRIPSTTP